MLELFIFLFLFPLIYSKYNSLLKVYYFIKLVVDFILVRLYLKFTGKVNNKLMKYLYVDIINNGCFAIKFVQWIVTRCKMLYPSDSHPEWLRIFKDFYEDCPEHSYNHTLKTLEENFDLPLEDIFEFIEEKPISSGSIAQVHRCKYKGQDCVIKVIHPDIKEKSSFCFSVLCFLNVIMNSWVGRKLYYIFPPLDMKYFLKSLEEQTDLNIEAKNMKTIAQHYEKDKKYIVVPECYYSSKNLIIMSYEKGEYFENIEEGDYTKYKIILCLSLLLRTMAIINGTVHGDLHCANWKVRKIEGEENDYQIVLYDYGLVIYPKREFISNFLLCWEKCDFDNLIKTAENFIEYHPFSENDFILVKKELQKELSQWNIKPLNVNTILNTLCKWAANNNIVYNGNFLNLLIIMSLLEDEFRKFGLTGSEKKEDPKETIECIFKVEYLNYINFCETKNIFTELKKYYEGILKNENIQFSELFHKLEYRLGCSGIDVQPTQEKGENDKKIFTMDL